MRPLASPEAEQAVLGALFVDPSAYDLVADRFEPHLFSSLAHRAIAEAMIAVVTRKLPLDAVTVLAQLGSDGREELAPRETVFGIARGVGTAANIEHYIGILHELWALREARAAASALLDDDSTAAAADLIAGTQRALSRIETGETQGSIPIGRLMQSLADELEAEAARKPGTEVLSTGFKSLDAVVGGFEPGLLQLYAARPGVGKSALAVAFARSLAARGIPVQVYWLEDTARRFAARVAAAEGAISGLVLRHGTYMRAPTWERLAGVTERVHAWPLYVEDTKRLTGQQLVARMRRARREHGIRVFITDHLGEIRLEETDRRDEALGEVARQFRDALMDLGAGGCLMHQLGRLAEQGGAPQLRWIFNSDVVGQVVRVAAFMSVEGCTFSIAFPKVNYGPPGVKVELGWDGDTMTVFEPEVRP